MITEPRPELRRAVAQAVSMVNSHSGETCVTLFFQSEDAQEVEFLANSAFLQGDAFQFTAGFETYGGSVDELTDIRTEVIGR